ncbi:MAG: efflux RND transporter permease subunit, partial [Bacteroidales bacterium]
VLVATGQTLNLMSMIGLVVMAGITINDSILKIDTINRLLRGGTPLLRALMEAGHIRLKPIIMTSITTILALLPLLFISGIGGQMQRPLAIAIMAGLAIGTMVSLYLLPSLYYLIYRLKKYNRQK